MMLKLDIVSLGFDEGYDGVLKHLGDKLWRECGGAVVKAGHGCVGAARLNLLERVGLWKKVRVRLKAEEDRAFEDASPAPASNLPGAQLGSTIVRRGRYRSGLGSR